MILNYCVTVFVTQFIWIWSRTWNVQTIADDNIPGVLLSGVVLHLSWLVSVAIGSVSMYEIISNFDWSYLPVVACSLSGGLIGSYVAMVRKI